MIYARYGSPNYFVPSPTNDRISAYVQIDLLIHHDIMAIGIQGEEGIGRVSKYALKYSVDCIDWETSVNSAGSEIVSKAEHVEHILE